MSLTDKKVLHLIAPFLVAPPFAPSTCKEFIILQLKSELVSLYIRRLMILLFVYNSSNYFDSFTVQTTSLMLKNNNHH